jgi:putative transcriptional regulator
MADRFFRSGSASDSRDPLAPKPTSLTLGLMDGNGGDGNGYFANQFLVAMPALDDANFGRTVTLLCEHTDKGALGLVINRPMNLTLAEMLEQMGLPREKLRQDPSVYWGGPVQPERGFVVHGAPATWDSSMPIGDDLFITTSRDVLAAIGNGQGPDKFFVALGYAGWGAGQLDEEVMRNSWLNTPVDRSILFDVSANERWRAATRLLGFDVGHLANVAGHA